MIKKIIFVTLFSILLLKQGLSAGSEDMRIPWIEPSIPEFKPSTDRPAIQPKPPSPEELESTAFKQAFENMKAARYPLAIVAYQTFIQTYPNSPRIADSHYWIGEAHFLQENYEAALEKYAHVMIYHPKTELAKQSALKAGETYVAMKNWPRAQKALKIVLKSHPKTTYALKAQNWLNKLKQQGHL